jgi:FkbH-like protein
MKYSEILIKNKKLSSDSENNDISVKVLSNTTIHQSKEIFEYYMRKNDVSANVSLGEYDNIIQDSFSIDQGKCVIIFWEPSNFIDGFQYKSNHLNKDETIKFVNKIKKDIDICLDNLKDAPIVLMNKFSSIVFNNKNLKEDNFDFICNELNSYLLEKDYENLLIVDINKVISRVGISESVDFRHFYSSKLLYTTKFLEEYIKYVLPVFLNKAGKSKKAIILDCDNTLWNGIVGEDGMEGIKMSSKSKEGVVFEEVQHIVSDLAEKGIIIGLCSKNNAVDVDEVIKSHPDFVLNEDQIVIKKVNWIDKATNLKSIAQELNIGLDSLVFIDDSDFEIDLINKELSEVTTLKRPDSPSEYPKMLRENLQLFYNSSLSEEDFKRINDYKAKSVREELKNQFSDIEEYLKSLDLCLKVEIDKENKLPRISQLTQKTNQFNLTTKRYSESEIGKFIKNEKYFVFSFSLSDRYSDSGLTSVVIVEIENDSAIIDSFLMSCRIIGRNVEFSINDILVDHFSKLGLKRILSEYSETRKNSQVKNLYERLGYQLLNENGKTKQYQLDIENYTFHKKEYIKVYNG